jgi:hypothetical protein
MQKETAPGCQVLRPSTRAGCRNLRYLAPLGLINSNTGGDSTGGDSRAGSHSSDDDSTGGDSRAGSHSSDDDNKDDDSSRPKRVLARTLGLMHRTVRLALSRMRLEAAARFPP